MHYSVIGVLFHDIHISKLKDERKKPRLYIMRARTRTIKSIHYLQPRGVLGHVRLAESILPLHKFGFPTFDPCLFPDPVEIIINILHSWNLISLMQGPLLVLLHALLPREHKQIPLQTFDRDRA